MKTLWQPEAHEELARRIAQLTPDNRAKWGRMSAQQMVCHLVVSLQMANGEKPVEPKRMPLRLPVIKHLVLYVLPFPKNAPTAPELIVASTPNTWQQDVDDLRTSLNRFVARGRDARWPDHPAFGRLSARDWGVLVYRHVDHHLRQFGA